MQAIMNAAIGLGDAQVAKSATDILLGADANKIVGHLRSVGGSFDEILNKQALYNHQSEEGRKGAIESANTVSDLMTIFKSLAKEISGLIGAAINPMLESFRDWIGMNKELIQSWLPKLVDGLKSAAWAFGLLVGATALGKLGLMIMGIVKLTKAIRIMGITALRSQLNGRLQFPSQSVPQSPGLCWRLRTFFHISKVTSRSLAC